MSELIDLTIRSDANETAAVHAMKLETDVRLMLQLRSNGVSTYGIARVLACSRNTVYRYLVRTDGGLPNRRTLTTAPYLW